MSKRTRRLLAVLFWFLASVGVLASTVAVWAHQTVLTDDGWTSLTSAMLDDPEVVAGTSQIITQQVSTVIDLEQHVNDLVPGPAILAKVTTERIEGWVAGAVAKVMSTDAFATVWAEGNRVAHAAAMDALRGGGEVVGTESGTVQLNAVPLIVTVLERLQAEGLIPASIDLPDPTASGTAETVTALESALGRDLPDDLGTITIVSSDRLAGLQGAVRAFDLMVIVLLVLTAFFAGLALWLSARRLRMVIWLALGAIGGLALARMVSSTILSGVAGALKDGPEGDTVRGVLHALADSATWFAAVVTGMAVGVLLAVLLLEWRARRRAAAGEAAAAPAAPAAPAGAEGAMAGAVAAPTSREWVRARAPELATGGLFVVAFAAIWRAAGPDVALPAAVIAGAWLAIVWFVAHRDEPAGEAASGTG